MRIAQTCFVAVAICVCANPGRATKVPARLKAIDEKNRSFGQRPLFYCQAQLGHHSLDITLGHYTRVVPELLGHLTKKLIKLLGSG